MQNRRVRTRPSLTKGEWGRLAKSATWDDYKNAKNEAVWLWKIHQKLRDGPGRHVRQIRVERVREQENKAGGRQIEESVSTNWAHQVELRRPKEENKKLNREGEETSVATEDQMCESDMI